MERDPINKPDQYDEDKQRRDHDDQLPQQDDDQVDEDR